MSGIFTLPNNVDLIQYDVDDVKVFANNLDGTFGTGVDVPSCDLFVTGLNTKNQTMRGDGRITAIASSPESAECQIRFGSFAAAVMEIILGSSVASSGTTPNRKLEMKVGAGQNFPFFSIVGRSPSGLANGGATLIWLPCVKIMQNVSLRVEYNAFMMPEVTAMAIGDPVLTTTEGLALLWEIKWYETAASISLPLP